MTEISIPFLDMKSPYEELRDELDSAYRRVNTFLFAFYVVRVVFFLTVFGALVADLVMFAGLVGLSISLNGGVAKPAVVPQSKVVFDRFKLHPTAHRPVGVHG